MLPLLGAEMGRPVVSCADDYSQFLYSIKAGEGDFSGFLKHVFVPVRENVLRVSESAALLRSTQNIAGRVRASHAPENDRVR